MKKMTRVSKNLTKYRSKNNFFWIIKIIIYKA